ncbi:hypothetical protein LINPERPRIM_LOCUS6956 [Linum perenne]
MESSDSPGFQLLTMSEESTFDDERGIHGGPVSVKVKFGGELDQSVGGGSVVIPGENRQIGGRDVDGRDLELLNSQPTMAESSATVKLDGGGATAEDWAGIGVGVELGLMLERWSTTGSRDLKSALDLRPRRLLEKLIKIPLIHQFPKLLTAAAVAVAQSLHHGKSQIFLGADEGSDLRLRKTVGRSRRIVAATTTKLHSCGFSDKT